MGRGGTYVGCFDSQFIVQSEVAGAERYKDVN